MTADGIAIRWGLPATYALPVAQIYLEAFGAKMLPILGSMEHGVAVMREDLRLENALGAMDAETLVGIAGLSFAGRRFWQPRRTTLVRVYGWPTGLVRAAILSLVAAGAEHRNRVHIEALAVRGDYRGRGIGARLIDATADLAREQGISVLSLDVVDTNPGARRLYERLGFVAVRTRRLPFARWSGFTAITEMAKRLQ
ncbi:MAG: GNAT family N-acetyltransferase [Anaerolineae bacterium]